MGRPKGYPKSGGKPKGYKDEKTIAWENLGDFLISSGAERAVNIMIEASDKDFMKYMEVFIEYFKPKQARTIVENDKSETIIKVKIGDNRD